MNAQLAQIISLVAYGNLFLSGGEVDLSTNSSFSYVSTVKFARYKSNQDSQGVEIAGSVSDWFTFLASNKATRLWNIAFAWQQQDVPEHEAVAFSGGVPTAIQADLPDGFELWYPNWITSDRKEKPWVVEYRSLMFPNSHALPLQKMSDVKDRLRHAVSQAEKFARQSDVNEEYWAGWFARSLQLLDSPDAEAAFQMDLLPNSGFSFEARQVLASAGQAYVFGGMGSWNDMGFAKQKIQMEYERITKELYEAIKFATVMASNSFAL